jgi:hypothetical protein
MAVSTNLAIHLLLFNLGIDTESERSKFLEDSMRLAKDISGNQTFNTVKPLLNFWAAFSPSKEVNPILILDSRHAFTGLPHRAA